MKELCQDFGVSRKTAHKSVARHAESGMKALEERSRALKSVTCRNSDEVERLICTEKRLRSTWGPKKIRQILTTKHGLESPPAISTVGEVLKRHGLVAERRRRGAVFKVEQGTLTAPERPNHVLGVDFKGCFLTGDGKRCDPLTVTDLHSRFILKIDALEEARTSFAKAGKNGNMGYKLTDHIGYTSDRLGRFFLPGKIRRLSLGPRGLATTTPLAGQSLAGLRNRFPPAPDRCGKLSCRKCPEVAETGD